VAEPRPAGARPGKASAVAPLTLPDLEKIMPASTAASRSAFLAPLNDAMVEFDINTQLRVAHFLGQVSFESGDLRYLQEQWGPTSAQRRYEPPAALASSLGNTEAGDGRKYLGRGIFQIVGRRNYTQLGQLLKLNLVDQPELAARPDVAARTAGAFWVQRGLSKLADADDVTAITRRISGGMLGLETRRRAVDRAKAVLLPAAP
jgi:putative chitinase